MSVKRERDDSDEEGEIFESPPNAKRVRRAVGAAPRYQHQNSDVDPTWGQKYVFSNLPDASSIPRGDEFDFEDDADAMAYLRTVRQDDADPVPRKQASSIPHMLVAPQRQIGPQLSPELLDASLQIESSAERDQLSDRDRNLTTGSAHDSGAFYDDGAYIAAPSVTIDTDDQAEYDTSHHALHAAYFAAILARYHDLRSVMQSRPYSAAKWQSRLPKSASRVTVRSQAFSNDHWSRVLRKSDPQLNQLSGMSKELVLRALKFILSGNFLCRGHTLSLRTSSWLWGLLARLPGPGELHHEEIAWVRELGRRAVLLGRSLAEMAALRAELADESLGIHGDDAEISHNSDSQSDDAEAGRFDDLDAYDSDTSSKQDTIVQEEASGTVATAHCAEDVVDNRSDDASVAMDLNSDLEAEVAEAATPDVGGGDADELEAAKHAFLSQLENGAEEPGDAEGTTSAANLRLRMNLRATLNMILTVAGEFYGQRDLLEFREPFVGM